MFLETMQHKGSVVSRMIKLLWSLIQKSVSIWIHDISLNFTVLENQNIIHEIVWLYVRDYSWTYYVIKIWGFLTTFPGTCTSVAIVNQIGFRGCSVSKYRVPILKGQEKCLQSGQICEYVIFYDANSYGLRFHCGMHTLAGRVHQIAFGGWSVSMDRVPKLKGQEKCLQSG